MTVVGTLIVERPSGPGPRTYKIEVDGVAKGEVRAGEELRLALAPGAHTVRAKALFKSALDLGVRVAPAATVRVRLAPEGMARID